MHFADDKGFEYKIPKDVMKKVNINYEEGCKGKGCIAMMIVGRKSELSKNTMKIVITTHESKILTIPTKVDVQAEGRRKTKQNNPV